MNGNIRRSLVTGVALLFLSLSSVRTEIIVYEYILDLNDTRVVNHYYDRAASGLWSMPVPEDGLEGWLLYAEPANACDIIKPPPSTHDGKPWIVMAKRNNCTFFKKALHAAQAGYDAIIIHNVGSDEAMAMGSDGGIIQISIPVVSVGESTANQLRLYSFDNDPRYTIYITDYFDISWLEKYLWPFFGVVTGCFCCMGIYVLVKWSLERRRMRRIASRRRLSTKQLNKIPTKKFKKGDAYEVCAICLEDYEENEKLRILPCNHAYHTKCVDPWLTKNRKFCPVCKRKILTKKEKEKMKRKEQEREMEEAQRQRRLLESREREDADRDEEEEREAEEEEEEETVDSSEEETEERDDDEGLGSQEAQPLIQDPPLTVVDRLRRFFRRRQTIEVDDDEPQPPLRDNQFRSSYGSLNNVDPINNQIEAAESHLQNSQEGPDESPRVRHHFHPEGDLARQIPNTVAVYATVHVEQHLPPDMPSGTERNVCPLPDQIV